MVEWTLVDTDILIDAAHKDEMAVTVLQNLESTSGLRIVSIVTQMELEVGCRNKTEQRELAKFLRRFSGYPFVGKYFTAGLNCCNNNAEPRFADFIQKANGYRDRSRYPINQQEPERLPFH